MRMRPWLRRLVTRGLALIPAVIVISLTGDTGTYKLLILSQVILSLQLPFATIPLIHFTSDKKKMGTFANPTWVKMLAILTAVIIVALNVKLVYEELTGWLADGPVLLWFIVLPIVAFLFFILIYITVKPLIRGGSVWESGVITASKTIARQIKSISISHIGVPLEHSDGDAEIISMALSLARNNQAKLTLLHVIDSPGAMVYGKESQSRHGAEDEAYLEELAREIEAQDLPVETMIRFGKVVDEIVKSVHETGFDMLVLGSHGHHGLGDIVYGQTVEGVRHAVKIPVVVVRATGVEQAQRNG